MNELWLAISLLPVFMMGKANQLMALVFYLSYRHESGFNINISFSKSEKLIFENVEDLL